MTINRLGFLRLLGLATSAAIVKACAPTKKPLPTSSPTISPIPPTLTPEPSPTTISHIVPEMVLVETGEFQMGSEDGYENESPIHTVEITRPFYMGIYEVTFEEFDTYCDDIQRFNRPDDNGSGRGKRPVVRLVWNDTLEYCNWLSEKEGLTPCYSGKKKTAKCDFDASGYRLPTEAEWEFAARGGKYSQGFVFSGSEDPDQVAWFEENSSEGAHPVGEKKPNELGLYDMCGNRFEWCWDWYQKDYYSISPLTDPLGPPLPDVASPFDLTRVRRGGSWNVDREGIRNTTRSFDEPSYVGGNGFRLVRTA